MLKKIIILILSAVTSLSASPVVVEEFWSAARTTEKIMTDAAPGTIALDDVVIPALPDGATIRGAYILIGCMGYRTNSSSIQGWRLNQYIQVKKSTGSYINGLCLNGAANYSYGHWGYYNAYSHFLWQGGIDVKAQVNGAGTYNFQWLDAEAFPDSSFFYYLRPGLKVIYEY